MLTSGAADGRANFHPIAHGRNLAERDARLRHTERPRIHAQEHHLFGRRAEAPQIDFVRVHGVDQGIMNIGDGRAEAEFIRLRRQFARRFDQ
jgi:hypothetical protein